MNCLKTLIFFMFIFATASGAFAKVISAEKDGVFYTIENGEILMTISNKFYGTHQKWQKILAANPKLTLKNLSPGTKIFIPGPFKVQPVVEVAQEKPAPVKAVAEAKVEKKAEDKAELAKSEPIQKDTFTDRKYRVQKNDTLFDISTKYFNTIHHWRDIAAANPHVKANNLKPGTVLLIPHVSSHVPVSLAEVEGPKLEVTPASAPVQEKAPTEASSQVATEPVPVAKAAVEKPAPAEAPVAQAAKPSTVEAPVAVVVPAPVLRYHTARSRDSFEKISMRYFGTKEFAEAVAVANPSVDPQHIKKGMKLVVPEVHTPSKEEKLAEKSYYHKLLKLNPADPMAIPVVEEKPVAKEAPIVKELPQSLPPKLVVAKPVVIYEPDDQAFQVKVQWPDFEKEKMLKIEIEKKERELKAEAERKERELKAEAERKEQEAKLALKKDQENKIWTEKLEKREQEWSVASSKKEEAWKVSVEKKEQEWKSLAEKKEKEWSLVSSKKDQEWKTSIEKKEQEWKAANDKKEQEWKSWSEKKEQELKEAHKENEKLKNANAELLARPARNPAGEEALLRMKEFEKANAQLVSENQDLKEELLKRKTAIEDLAKAQSNLKETRIEFMNCKAQKDDKYAQQLQPMASLAETQAQLLQEKARILSQRYWLTKNKYSESCELKFENPEKAKKEDFLRFVQYLNTELGSNYVFVEPGENSVKFQIPGRAVYNYTNPSVTQNYESFLYKVSRELEHFPVESINIAGHTTLKKISTEKNETISGSKFVLRQALFLQDLFIDRLGWKAQSVKASSFANSLIVPRSGDSKMFEFTVKFKAFDDKEDKKDKRSIASIKKDPLLENLGTSVLTALGEPELASTQMVNDGLELHMSRLYFYEGDSNKLSEAGKQRLAKILSIFSNVDDAQYEIAWVPGQLENNKSQTELWAETGLEQVKDYLVNDLKVADTSIKMSYWTNQHNLKEAFNVVDDRANRRLVFRIVANSRVTRPYSGK